jgi:hypothetical protein
MMKDICLNGLNREVAVVCGWFFVLYYNNATPSGFGCIRCRSRVIIRSPLRGLIPPVFVSVYNHIIRWGFVTGLRSSKFNV